MLPKMLYRMFRILDIETLIERERLALETEIHYSVQEI